MRAVNLLPDSSRLRRPTGKLGGSAYVVLGGLAIALVMAVAYVVTGNDINETNGKIAAARAETEAAHARAGSVAAFSDFAQIKEARLASVRDHAAVRFDWERLMREVSLVVPDGIWLVDMSAASGPQDAASGAAPSGTTGATTTTSAVPSLVLGGCAKGQPSVAALLVRLRKLHRAQDVNLTESAREGAGVGGAPADSAGSSSSDGCPGGRYRFEASVAFAAPVPGEGEGDETVPAALGGGS